ncbi:MAG TPA: 4Fe-4S dicluster-binding protein, partial [bacterium]|nr:4Fe-4S dicluster-binding protein [bacterium]
AVMHFGYDIIDDLKEGMATYLANKGLQNVSHIIGRSLPFITSHEELCYEKKIKSVINDILCVRCGDCVIACQDGGHMAITADIERKPVVDNDKCVGCGLCRLVCPVRGCVEINSCR